MESLIVVIAILSVGAITPGPNNFMVMAAGARGGLPAAVPVIIGVVVGGLLLIALAWSGVAVVLESAPRLRMALTSGGAAYLVWLGGGMMWQARHVSDASSGSPPVERGFPCTWLGVAAFQLLNPKAWIMLVTTTAVMSRSLDGAQGLGALSAIYSLRSMVSLTVWAAAGSAIGRFLNEGHSRRWFNGTMGGLLIALAVLMVAGEL